MVYDHKGKFLSSWGEGQFTYRTHGITHRAGRACTAPTTATTTVRKFTPQGKLLLTLGTMDKASDNRLRTEGHHDGVPSRRRFQRPTNLAVGPKGDLYISDGYGNCRVHQFSPGGELKALVGRARQGPRPVHPPARHRGRRGRAHSSSATGNDRIQIFSPDGEYLAEWTDTQRPTHLVFDPQGRAYVSELWWHKGQTSQRHGPITDPR